MHSDAEDIGKFVVYLNEMKGSEDILEQVYIPLTRIPSSTYPVLPLYILFSPQPTS